MSTQTELADFFTLLDEAHQDRVAREAAYRARLDDARPALAEHLTQTLIPADLRTAGIRFEWAEAG